MRQWNIRPSHDNATVPFYATCLIGAFGQASEVWPDAEMLVCDSADPTPERLELPATYTLRIVSK